MTTEIGSVPINSMVIFQFVMSTFPRGYSSLFLTQLMSFGRFALDETRRFHAHQRVSCDGGAAGATPEALRWGWEGMEISPFFAIFFDLDAICYLRDIFDIWGYFTCYFIIDEFV